MYPPTFSPNPRFGAPPRFPAPATGRKDPRGKKTCRFFPQCHNMDCPFEHPKVSFVFPTYVFFFWNLIVEFQIRHLEKLQSTNCFLWICICYYECQYFFMWITWSLCHFNRLALNSVVLGWPLASQLGRSRSGVTTCYNSVFMGFHLAIKLHTKYETICEWILAILKTSFRGLIIEILRV